MKLSLLSFFILPDQIYHLIVPKNVISADYADCILTTWANLSFSSTLLHGVVVVVVVIIIIIWTGMDQSVRIAMGWANGPRSQTRERIFLRHRAQTDSGTLPGYQMDIGDPFPEGIKRPTRDASHSSPSGMHGAYLHSHLRLRGAILKHRYNYSLPLTTVTVSNKSSANLETKMSLTSALHFVSFK